MPHASVIAAIVASSAPSLRSLPSARGTPAPRHFEDGAEVGAARLAQRRPQVADATYALGERRGREVSGMEARVDLAPGERRRHASEVRATRAVRRCEGLAAEVLHIVYVDSPTPRVDGPLDRGDARMPLGHERRD